MWSGLRDLRNFGFAGSVIFSSDSIRFRTISIRNFTLALLIVINMIGITGSAKLRFYGFRNFSDDLEQCDCVVRIIKIKFPHSGESKRLQWFLFHRQLHGESANNPRTRLSSSKVHLAAENSPCSIFSRTTIRERTSASKVTFDEKCFNPRINR